MTVLLYAIAENEACADFPGEGLGGQPLRKVAHKRLAALVSDRPEALEPSESVLLDYEQAVQRLMTTMPLLPAQFATAAEDDSAIERLLGEREQEFLAGIERVRGAVELGLRAEWPADDQADGVSGQDAGTRYMRRRLEQRRRAQEILQTTQLTFAGVVRASASKLATGPRVAFSGSYLVGVADVDEFLRRLRRLEDEISDATFVCTGPWPPYSFSNPGDGQ